MSNEKKNEKDRHVSRMRAHSGVTRGRRVNWFRLVLGGALVLLIVTLGIGYYVVDVFVHPSLWNTFVFVAMIAFTVIVIVTNLRWRGRKRRRRR